MGYQSEAQLEEQLIKKLRTQQYIFKKIDDYEALEDNFREQIEKFNANVLDTPLTDAEFSRIINYLCGKTVFTSAKQLRDQISNPHFKWGSNFNPSGVFLWFRQRRDFAVPFLLVAS